MAYGYRFKENQLISRSLASTTIPHISGYRLRGCTTHLENHFSGINKHFLWLIAQLCQKSSCFLLFHKFCKAISVL